MSDEIPVSPRAARWTVVTIILVVLLVSSPTVGVVDLTPPSESGIGDGTANVTVSSVPTDDVRMTRGRFGTDVVYLRIPPATVDVHSVTGRPRLVYVARVPELGFERLETTQLDEGTRGEQIIRPSARAFTYDRVGGNTYRVELVLRVQSFEVNEIVYRRNVTVTAPNGTG